MWQPSSPTEQQRRPSAAEPNLTTRQKVEGKRVAQVVRLRKECVEEYKACHAKVWPEVLKQIKDCNMEDCKCYALSPMVLSAHQSFACTFDVRSPNKQTWLVRCENASLMLTESV